MHGAFDDEYLEQRKSSTDTEFTLGAGTMLLLSAGLVVVCGLCFGLGYIVGHRGTASQAAVQEAPANPQPSSSQQKPSARAQTSVPAPTQAAVQSENSPQPAASDVSQSSPAAPAQNLAAATGQPQVRAVLPAATTTPQPSIMYTSRLATTPPQPQARPAPAPMPSTTALWVQIAAVSHVEDAQVLTNALRKHGYAVTPRREADNLIHVRIGPFTTSDEANRWRVKLLDDGYNAEIQR